MKILQPLALLCLASICSGAVAQDGEVIHDAEHYILLAQHAEDWARDDATVDAVLAEFSERNGGRDLVVHYSPRYESLGVWYNDTGGPVQAIDFFGKPDHGQLTRVENLRPGMFWHVWAEFFPNTDINRGIGAGAAPETSDKPVQEPDSDTGDLQIGSAS